MSSLRNYENIEFDFEERRKREKGTRNALTAFEKSRVKSDGFITKELQDSNNLIGKKHRQRLEKLSERSKHVAYSINKQKRWTKLEPFSLLENVDGNIPEYVYERSLGSDKVTAVHTKKSDGELKTFNAKGKGCNPVSLTSETRKKNKRNEKLEKSDQASTQQAAKIVYNLELSDGHTKVIKPKGVCKGSKTRRFDIDLDDWFDDSESYSDEEDFREEDQERNHKNLTIDDCFIEKHSVVQSIIDVSDVEFEEVTFKDVGVEPFQLLDLSKVVGTSSFFETFDVNTKNWKNFDMDEQIGQLEQINIIDVKCMDTENRRIMVDASLLADFKVQREPFFVILIEKTHLGNQLAISVNFSSVADQNEAITNIKCVLKVSGTLKDVVLNIATIARSWVRENPKVRSRFDEFRDMYYLSVNSRHLASTSKHFKFDEMVQIVKQDASLTFSSYKENDYVKSCSNCQKMCQNDMFQLSEYWKCRTCLRHEITTMIRAGKDPLALQFVLPDGLSTYDVLPSIIPVSLVSFFTQKRMEDLITAGSSRKITKCPSCEHVVIISPDSGYKSYQCDNCNNFWCEDCRSEPHFPMSCEQYKEWTSRWDAAYDQQYLGRTVITFTCFRCSTNLKCHDTGRVFCTNCVMRYDGNYLKKVYESCSKKSPGSYYYHADHLAIQLPQLVNRVNAQFAKHCGEARQLRLSPINFDRMLNDVKEFHPDTFALRELRKTVLFIVENGLAWIYVKKDNDRSNDLKRDLIQMKNDWKQLEIDIDLKRTDLKSRITKMEKNLKKILLALKMHC